MMPSFVWVFYSLCKSSIYFITPVCMFFYVCVFVLWQSSQGTRRVCNLHEVQMCTVISHLLGKPQFLAVNFPKLFQWCQTSNIFSLQLFFLSQIIIIPSSLTNMKHLLVSLTLVKQQIWKLELGQTAVWRTSGFGLRWFIDDSKVFHWKYDETTILHTKKEQYLWFHSTACSLVMTMSLQLIFWSHMLIFIAWLPLLHHKQSVDKTELCRSLIWPFSHYALLLTSLLLIMWKI